MLAHNLKDILSIVPELQEHIKKANIEEEYPLDNKDGAVASYMRCYYLSKVAHKVVDPDVMEKLEKAAQLYNIKETVLPFIQKMKKYAEETKKEAIEKAAKLTVKEVEALFEGSLTGFFDIEKAAEEAKELMSKYASEIQSSELKRYAGKAYFIKEAAIETLETRAKLTGKEIFTKIAESVAKHMDFDSPQEAILAVCRTVTTLDKKAGLNARGFNFYKEALSVAPERVGANGTTILTVKLAGKPIAYEKIERLGKRRIGQYLGKDVASEMTSDPVMNKRILESLPLDLQRVLLGILKNV
jgi:hypothetical protein